MTGHSPNADHDHNEQHPSVTDPLTAAPADATAARVRAEERAAITRLARAVASDAARANGRKNDAEVAANFVEFILTQAYAKRDEELSAGC